MCTKWYSLNDKLATLPEKLVPFLGENRVNQVLTLCFCLLPHFQVFPEQEGSNEESDKERYISRVFKIKTECLFHFMYEI